jgi:N-acetylglucosaminyl-diphospho-decaprenol L-rhamnosyltransferase
MTGAARRSPTSVTVSVIIVNWNAGQALDACLASLAAGGSEPEVIVVDNASSDGSAAAGRARHPRVRLLETGANLGFAAGANRGAEAARGDVLVFLNPDARVMPGALAALVAALEGAPGAGIAGGGLVHEGGGWQPGAARFGPLAHLLLDTTPGRLGARLRRAPHRVDWVYGTFMAVRRDLFRQLGGFDPRYFLYGEDLDLCYRAARVGVRTIHVPAARAVHGANLSAAQRFAQGREAEVVKGEMRFYAARGGRGALRLFRAVAACKFGVKTALAVVLGRRLAATTYGRVVRACLTFDPHGLAP